MFKLSFTWQLKIKFLCLDQIKSKSLPPGILSIGQKAELHPSSWGSRQEEKMKPSPFRTSWDPAPPSPPAGHLTGPGRGMWAPAVKNRIHTHWMEAENNRSRGKEWWRKTRRLWRDEETEGMWAKLGRMHEMPQNPPEGEEELNTNTQKWKRLIKNAEWKGALEKVYQMLSLLLKATSNLTFR